MSTDDRQAARESMVQEQLVTRGILDARVLGAMRRVPRHLFVPPEHEERAYDDVALGIGLQQTISQPLMVALMAQLLALAGTERVLEVGTGSGYNAAILSLLAREVVTIERHAELAEQAQERLRALGYANITVVLGDGSEGYAPAAPYDGILVAAAAPHVPEALVAQLAPNGRLVLPVGDSAWQILTVVSRDAKGNLSTQEHGECAFVPLVGAQGWSEVPDLE